MGGGEFEYQLTRNKERDREREKKNKSGKVDDITEILRECVIPVMGVIKRRCRLGRAMTSRRRKIVCSFGLKRLLS